MAHGRFRHRSCIRNQNPASTLQLGAQIGIAISHLFSTPSSSRRARFWLWNAGRHYLFQLSRIEVLAWSVQFPCSTTIDREHFHLGVFGRAVFRSDDMGREVEQCSLIVPVADFQLSRGSMRIWGFIDNLVGVKSEAHDVLELPAARTIFELH